MSPIFRTLAAVCSTALITVVTVGVPASPAWASTTCFTVTDNVVSDGGTCTDDVTLPAGVTSIADDAFRESNLTSIVIPKSVTSIGARAFFRTSALTSVTFEAGSGLTTIADDAFFRSGLTSIVIPKSVTSIGVGAFYGASALTSVTFGGDAPNVGFRAFFDLPSGATANISSTANGFGENGDMWNGLIVEREAAPTLSALTPEFGTPVRTADGFTVDVTNYDDAFTWEVEGDGGSAAALVGSTVTVSGVAPGVEVTVTVTTQRDGYDSGSARVTGAAADAVADDAPDDVADDVTEGVTDDVTDDVTEGASGDGVVLPSVTCSPLPVQVGSLVTCTVAGGEAGAEILWRAAFNPAFAGEGVTLDASGSREFSFVVPAVALGEVLTVELVGWAAPVSLGVAGGPVPVSVPAGGGPVPVWTLALAALAGVGLLRRGMRTEA